MAYGTLNAGTITPGSGNTLAISEAVTVPTPTATTHAATKSYVDSAASQATTAAQGVGTGDSPTFDDLTLTGKATGIGELVGVSYLASYNAAGSAVTVENNKSYSIQITYYESTINADRAEYWTASVDGSGVVSVTEVVSLNAAVVVYSPSTNVIKGSTSSATYGLYMALVFEQ